MASRHGCTPPERLVPETQYVLIFQGRGDTVCIPLQFTHTNSVFKISKQVLSLSHRQACSHITLQVTSSSNVIRPGLAFIHLVNAEPYSELQTHLFSVPVFPSQAIQQCQFLTYQTNSRQLKTCLQAETRINEATNKVYFTGKQNGRSILKKVGRAMMCSFTHCHTDNTSNDAMCC